MVTCHEACIYKRDAARLGRRVETLESGLELERLEKKLEAELRAKLNAANERDRLKRKVEEWEKKVQELKDRIEHYKYRLVCEEEAAQDAKKEADEKVKSLKKEIGKLQKELSNAVWRLEKVQRDLGKQHKKEMKQQKAEYESKISRMEKMFQEELAAKEKLIRELTAHLQEGTIPAEEEKGKGRKSKGGTAGGKVKRSKTDSTTSSVPPGQDPNHPTIPNNRTKSGLKPGAQEGHAHHPRKKYEPTTVVELPVPQEVLDHPDDYYEISPIKKQVVSVRLVVEVTEYVARQYRHHKTRATVHSEFPEDVGHLEVNYDASVDAMTAYLHSVCNVSYGKIQELLREGPEGQSLDISTGRLANLEKTFSGLTGEERARIAEALFRGKTMNLDGTCARVNGKQKQVLVMCNKENVLYKMTGCKGEKAIEGTPVENYQGTTITDSESTFTKKGQKNQRCCIHEGRYLNRASQDTPDFQWSGKMRELLQRIQHERNTGLENGETCMPVRKRKKVYDEYDQILVQGMTEYRSLCPELLDKHLLRAEKKLEGCAGRYGIDFGSITRPSKGSTKKDCEIMPELQEDILNNLVKDINMLIRLMADKEHYLLFLEDYSIPPHNNDAEKCARTVKVHMKPNGGMRSEEYVGYYADTASVLESERRKGKSRFSKLIEAFSRKTKAIKGKMEEALKKKKE